MPLSRHLRFAVSVFALVWAMTSAAQAQCVQVALIDDAGNIITPGGLVVGIKVGETVIYNVGLPTHREQKEVRQVPCPADLVNQIRELYNRSCTSDRARVQAAVSNNTSLDIVVEQCGNLRSALQSGR